MKKHGKSLMKEQLEAIRQEAEAALQTCTDAKQLMRFGYSTLEKKEH